MFTNDHFIGATEREEATSSCLLPLPHKEIFWNSLTAAHFSGSVDLFLKFKFLRVDGVGRGSAVVKEELLAEAVEEARTCSCTVKGKLPGALKEREGSWKGRGKRDWELEPADCFPRAEISGADPSQF